MDSTVVINSESVPIISENEEKFFKRDETYVDVVRSRLAHFPCESQLNKNTKRFTFTIPREDDSYRCMNFFKKSKFILTL